MKLVGEVQFWEVCSFPLHHKNSKFQEPGGPLPLSTAKLTIVLPGFYPCAAALDPADSWVAIPCIPSNPLRKVCL